MPGSTRDRRQGSLRATDDVAAHCTEIGPRPAMTVISTLLMITILPARAGSGSTLTRCGSRGRVPGALEEPLPPSARYTVVSRTWRTVLCCAVVRYGAVGGVRDV